MTPQSPPRTSAPGPPDVPVSAPPKHWSSLLKPPQVGHAMDRGTQSATHSIIFPTMSKAPKADTQLLREPVLTTVPAELVLQSVVPLSGPGSGVPVTAT